ncbi:MAG: Fe-S cluster assembly protein SufD [Flavobacteriales bacterium]|nr:Fe-S cluster assembly protein SufD [Flavobacteriales bacterium]MBT3962970.1 Fe-S cluster assembly protein SufD [Flavobacteriales bacterium]MBT4705609.1 Fe-S cluster assembly protein SufD [Flavobacteriales bacterium]MBT4931148.1 Fe-S cluster assembly protein SufD [Flavobacteriales bacterium]MBT5133444.1 Fe-S cluster assembly protein SufD [Flavobacteriales bacterium]
MGDKQTFLKQFDSIPAVFPVQGTARAHIHNGLDFPTTRDEYWKYTRVNAILDKDYIDNSWMPSSINEYSIPAMDSIDIVFVNGGFNKELSSNASESGLVFGSVLNQDGENKNLILEHLGKYADSEKHAFSAFNTSYFKDGAFIRIKKGCEIKRPLRILNLSGGVNQANNLRNLFLIEENAQVQIIAHNIGAELQGGFVNVVTEVSVGDGSNLEYYLIENDGDESSLINTTHVHQAGTSTAKVVTLTQSGRLVRNNLNFDINGQGCESNMYGIYFTSGKQHLDNHTYADHRSPNCESNELYKGVMTERSTGVFNGKIMVRQEAQKTNAFQSNQNILLSDNASINTKPELEIYADDVKCSHGCTIGQLDDEALFYLRSRGLNKLEASKLLIQAFAGDVLEEISIPALQEYVAEFIHKKFEDLDA